MNWDTNKLKTLPVKGGVIFKGDERIETYSEDTMMKGRPDAVLVARDEQEISGVMAYCDKNKIPVTFCGSQTSMTGASVPLEGLLISTEKLEGVCDIYKKNGKTYVDVRSGTIVADFQKAVDDAGFFYPVAPTSRDECRIGANVATNATGEDSYKYGPARCYIKKVELVLPSGKIKILERDDNEKPSCERNRAGYFVGWKNPIDLIIGSEGTLGFVKKTTFELLPKSDGFFSALIPCSSNWDALNFVIKVASKKSILSPRALEFIDSSALKPMQTAEGFPKLPNEVKALLYIKQEFKDEAEKNKWLEIWFNEIVDLSGEKLAEHVLIAETQRQTEDFRLWRHRIPESENEVGRSYWADGGGKIGSDWWVPIDRLSEMMKYFYEVAESTKLPHIAFAHIGAGHPHTNYFAKNAEEKLRANEALKNCCRKAVELGGGVAGEHGLGKIHTDLLLIQYSAKIIEQMKNWKREYDPNWILGVGNIFA